jgi:hypothetical protein
VTAVNLAEAPVGMLRPAWRKENIKNLYQVAKYSIAYKTFNCKKMDFFVITKTRPKFPQQLYCNSHLLGGISKSPLNHGLNFYQIKY